MLLSWMRLFKWLRKKGYLCSCKGERWNMLTQLSIERTTQAVRQAMDRKNFLQSFSNVGQPRDNAVAEAFFRFLKEEELYRRKFSCTEELKNSLFSYIDGFYNTRRPHSSNDELTPNEKEALF